MNLKRAPRTLAWLFLAVTLSLLPGGGLVPGLPAGEQSDEVLTLLKDLAGQLDTPQGDQGTRANNAAWEDTAAFLQQRFGSEDKERLPSKAAGTKETSTWMTSSLKGEHLRAIRATWNREKGKLKIEVKGDAHGWGIGQQQKKWVGPYLVHIQADVVEEKDEKGNPILRARLPEDGAVLSLAVGCDEKDPIDLNGEWKDNQGRKWVIEHTPLICAERMGSITLTRINSRGYKVVHKGSITNWQITAKHIIAHADAVEEPPQDWLRQEIASGKKGRGIFDISLFPRLAEDGTLSLEGTFTGFNVKWNPDEKVVRSVEPSYEKPLVLSQAARKDQFRIVRVEVDTGKWKSRLLGVKGDVGKIEEDIKRYAGRLKEAQASLKNLEQEKKAVKYKLRENLEKIAAQESRLKGPLLPDKVSVELFNRLRAKADLQKQIEDLDAEIDELVEKRPPNWSETLPRKQKVMKDYLEELQNLDSRIKEDYAAQEFDPDKKLAEMQKELKQFQDKYYNLIKTEVTPLDSKLRDTGRSIDRYKEYIKEQEVRLTDLRQKLNELDEQNTPFIDQVLVFDGQGKEIGRWENWAPFEGIKYVNDEAERYRKIVDKLRSLKEESQEQFQEAAQEARVALQRVTRAIMESFYLQAVIEGEFLAYEAAKGWGKGGPLGALTEALSEAASEAATNWLLGESIIEESNPQRLEAMVEEKYGFRPSLLAEFDVMMVASSAISTLLEEGILDPIKEQVDQKITAPAHQYLRGHMLGKWIEACSLLKDYKISLQTLTDKAKKIGEYGDYLKSLKKAEPKKLKDFAKGFLKNYSKNYMKRRARVLVEDEAWINYFEKDVVARMHFWWQQHSTVHYWLAYDNYLIWQRARDRLVEGYDPKSGFKEIKSKPLLEGRTYGIGLEFRNPQGIKEKVWLGLREANPQGAADLHKFAIQATNLKPNNKKGDVVLKIEVQ